MIVKIKMWCEQIIVAIIICIIIESIMPDGTSKKYLRVIIGIYIMFVVLNPMLNVFNYDFSFEDIFDYDYEEAYYSIDNNMKEVYILGIEETIKNDIEKMGFEVLNIKIFVDREYENIEKIEIEISENNIKIEEIKIGGENTEDKSKNNNENTEVYDENEINGIEKIKKYLEENYFVSSEQIIFL